MTSQTCLKCNGWGLYPSCDGCGIMGGGNEQEQQQYEPPELNVVRMLQLATGSSVQEPLLPTGAAPRPASEGPVTQIMFVMANIITALASLVSVAFVINAAKDFATGATGVTGDTAASTWSLVGVGDACVVGGALYNCWHRTSNFFVLAGGV